MFPSNLPVHTSDMQRTMTFHISFASLFLNSQSFSAWLGSSSLSLSPVLSVAGGRGCGGPVARLWPHCSWPSPSSQGSPCAMPGAALLPQVTLSPFGPCQEKASMFALISSPRQKGSAGSRMWRSSNVSVKGGERRKEKLLALISTLLVFPFFKPRECFMFFFLSSDKLFCQHMFWTGSIVSGPLKCIMNLEASGRVETLTKMTFSCQMWAYSCSFPKVKCGCCLLVLSLTPSFP